MKLIIFGSTGGTGQQVLAQALEQGHDVTAFARNPEKIVQRHEKLEVVKGNVLEKDSLERAMQEKDAVICTLGSQAMMDRSKLRANGTKNIIRAMKKTGVKRFVCQSSLGVGNSRDVLPFHYKYFLVPFMLRYVYADHEIQEKYIKESQLDWIIVRPAVLTNGKKIGLYRDGFLATDKKVTLKVSRADVADFMLRQLVDDTYLHQTPCISY